MTISGTAGIDFDLQETANTDTGSIIQDYDVETDIANLTVSSTDLVYSMSGTIGTTAYDIDLNSIINATGTNYDLNVVRNQEGDYTTLKMLVIHNTTAVTNTLTFGSPAANSLFTWNSATDGITLDPTTSIAIALPTAKTISTNGKFNLVGSATGTTFEIYVLGT